MKTLKTQPRCQSRKCRRFVKMGMRYCASGCQRAEKNARERDRYRSSAYFPADARRKALRPFKGQMALGDTNAHLTLLAHTTAGKAGKSQALFYCSCGGTKITYTGNVRSGLTRHCGNSRHPDSRMVERPTYSTAHKRLGRMYGPARALPCWVCGQVTETNQFAYLWTAGGAELTDTVGKDKGKRFALDADCYRVACGKHHAATDRAYTSTWRKGTVSLVHVAVAAMLPALGQPPTRTVPRSVCRRLQGTVAVTP